MDEQGRPTMFHQTVRQSIAGRVMNGFNDFKKERGKKN